MKSIKQKLSIILVLILLVNILLPDMSALAAEANNSVAPSELGNARDELVGSSFVQAHDPDVLVESPNPLDKLPDSSDSKVKIQGARTAIIKAAIRVLVRYLRYDVDTVISKLRGYVPGRYLTVLRNNAGRIAGFLETLLKWEDLAYQTIYDQTYNFLRWNLRYAHSTSHWIALGIKWIIEWGLL